VCGECITDNIPHKSNRGVEGKNQLRGIGLRHAADIAVLECAATCVTLKNLEKVDSAR
jgi:hypothetical protein